MAYQDKAVQVDGLKTRYVEDGSGPAAICLHVASPGSFADVFHRNLGPLLPEGQAQAKAPAEGEEGTTAEPTVARTRALYNHRSITPEVLELRQQWDAMDRFHESPARFLPN